MKRSKVYVDGMSSIDLFLLDLALTLRIPFRKKTMLIDLKMD